MKKSIICFLLIMISFISFSSTDKNKVCSNKLGFQDKYNYELLKDKIGNACMKIESKNGFSCKWNDVNIMLCRKGHKYDGTLTYDQFGNITILYESKYYPRGNSYLGIYGWTMDPNIEYYIIENWGFWRPPGAHSKGTIRIDNGLYDIYEIERVKKPTIMGIMTYKQFWSVRRSRRKNGTVSVSKHFEAWEKMGMKLGNVIELAMAIEGYQSSGEVQIKNLVIKTENNILPITDKNKIVKPKSSIFLMGDVNNSNSVDIVDALLIAQFYVGRKVENFDPLFADVDCSNKIDIVDALLVAKLYIGMIKKFRNCMPFYWDNKFPDNYDFEKRREFENKNKENKNKYEGKKKDEKKDPEEKPKDLNPKNKESSTL